ncbi:hypothetical protein GS398_04670 [Pedobacter sp. HMF7056]|uniref:ABC transporter permease n=2 Tax=Hufsiella ginkgonis TaxID=2695274 RepID=A0A7K1XUE8_9SPHI|nr:DUF6526 family protein [Hufsiella ginkgonis]MXV14580.1 hypothetical protein [Hufsiella ginkgonis]
MKVQNYGNHAKYYAAHHFVFYPLLVFFIGCTIHHAIKDPERAPEFWAITVTLVMIGWLSFMVRQHYALGNQNRIVRLEMRLRYYQLMHERFEPLESKLSFGQIAALRFAADEELVALVKLAAETGLSSREIKRAVKNWEPDHMRV